MAETVKQRIERERQARAAAERQEALERRAATTSSSERGFDPYAHPGLAESLIPVWVSGREAVADFHEGGAGINGALAASDLLERYAHGTPTWSKVTTGAVVKHPAGAAKARADRR